MKGNCKRVYWIFLCVWLPHYISWLPLWWDNDNDVDWNYPEFLIFLRFNNLWRKIVVQYFTFPPCGENSASAINFSASKGSQQQLQRNNNPLLFGKFIRNFNTIVKLWTITYGYFPQLQRRAEMCCNETKVSGECIWGKSWQ